ncbi:MAG: hypothetical protein LH702_18610 [Phormidesmis sp. CAN_BIN44]|nr:hypothetical protein [Phormidesmis sp. CAN_BIN44]
MTDSTRATRATVTLGTLTIDAFMLPDGSYRMSQTQTAECVGLSERNAREFLQSKALKSLLGEGYTPAISEIEPDPDQVRGSSRIRSLSLEVVSAYWMWQTFRGNKQALALCMALISETLERRFDAAFGVTRSEDDFNQRLSDRIIAQLENDLGEAFNVDSVLRSENEYLMQVLRDNGIDPWALPESE